MSWRVWTLIAAGMLLNLVILGLGPVTSWVNSFIQTDTFRHEIEAKASTAAGGTVAVNGISFSFLSGVKLNGLTSKLEAPQGTVVSQVESVHCSFSWWALLERRLRFDGVTLVKPQIVLTQQPPSNVPMPTAPGAPAAGNGSGKTAPPPSFSLEHANISDGRLSIRDASGATKADLQEVTVTADTSGYTERKEVAGKIVIGTIALPQNLSLTDFTAPFSYHAGAVEAGPFAATAFGGQLTGGYQLAADGTPSRLQINGDKIEVEKIAGMAHPGAPSPLSGALAMQSDWQGVETGQLTGEGDAQITNGKLSGVSVLHQIASVLRVPALSDPELSSVTVHFQVAGGRHASRSCTSPRPLSRSPAMA